MGGGLFPARWSGSSVRAFWTGLDRILFGFLRLGHIFLLLSLSYLGQPAAGAVVKLDSASFDTTVGGAEVVFINFYADWCRFSQMLSPVFEEASNRFNNLPAGKVVFAAVDCDRHVDVAQKFNINKYPTLKLWRSGQVAKREYRGQRSVDALAQFVQNQLESGIKDIESKQDLEGKIDGNKRNIVAYFFAKSGPEWEGIRKVASNLREDCHFYTGAGQDKFPEELAQGNRIVFKPPNSGDEILFSGNMQDEEYVRQWITDKCIPLVREITFENAEELTEEGLPFLILFRDPNDKSVDEVFTQQCAAQLADQKSSMNFLVADGKKFAHPLHHLGKSERDLPILAIDSFRHMYLFPDMKDLTVPGKLRQFVLDLHSGKLHREFHHGPDPTQPPSEPGEPGAGPGQPQEPERTDGQPTQEQQKTSPPESVFEKLKPSSNRYTILKDEL